MNNMRAIHPGEVLAAELETIQKMSIDEFSEQSGISVMVISDILDEKSPLTREIAYKLGKFFGTTQEFWLNVQAEYDAKKAKDGKEWMLEQLNYIVSRVDSAIDETSYIQNAINDIRACLNYAKDILTDRITQYEVFKHKE